MEILDGKGVSEKILDSLKERSKELSPTLAVMLIGNDPASSVYVKNKSKACEKCGINFIDLKYDENVTEEEILNKIVEVNEDPSINGIIVQLPVPKQISVKKILSTISPEKDVDGFTVSNVGKMFTSKDDEDIPPATPGAIIRLLEEYNIDPSGMDAVVVGRSNIVGKPISAMLLNRSATVSVCHSRTKDLSSYTKRADLIVAAVGIPKFIKEDMIKEGTIIIDVGINRLEDGSLCGDVDYEACKDKCSFITPVPGGIGPMTIAQLMINVTNAAEMQKN